MTSSGKQSMPIMCSHCNLGSTFEAAWLRAATDSAECIWCNRAFAPDVYELLDTADFAEHEFALFPSLVRRTPDDDSAVG